MQKVKKGFTLVELIITILIMSFLTAIMVPALLTILNNKRATVDETYLNEVAINIKSSLTDRAIEKEAQKLAASNADTTKFAISIESNSSGNINIMDGYFNYDPAKKLSDSNFGLNIASSSGANHKLKSQAYYNHLFIYTVTMKTDSTPYIVTVEVLEK